MNKITKESIAQNHEITPRRRCFTTHTGIQEKKGNNSKSFSVKFCETIQPIFEEQTGYTLFQSPQYGNFYRIIKSDEEFKKISEWEKSQGTRVFLKDSLSLSIALDLNLEDNTSGQHTIIGQLESAAKHQQDEISINELARLASETIDDLPYFKDADLICAVPSSTDKDFDLPRSVTSLISQHVDKPDVTSGFIFGEQKKSVKSASFDEKWDIWEKADVSFQNMQGRTVKDKKIILIDDKYQSGTTLQYVAMKLQEAGASEIYGLCLVKTLRDTDNT